MTEAQQTQLQELARTLVTPERYQKTGELALAPVIQLPLPEMARLYEFPSQDYDQV